VAARFRAVHVDFGTGDGAFVRGTSKLEPDVLFVGIDAIADNLRDASRRAGSNALFGRLALEDAPGDLAGFADRLTVLFPWGSLLRAVTAAEPDALARLSALCKPDAEVRFLFELASDARSIESRYREAGLELSGRPVTVEQARALPTTWAKKLGFSGKQRSFWEFRGRIVSPAFFR
jgi:16S rRNA (adenine(1408)-N(1))-methyltransferase